MIEFSLYKTSKLARWNQGYFAVSSNIDKAFEEIRENDYDLKIPRDVATFEQEEGIGLMAVRKERLALQTELDRLEIVMAGYLKELGYGS